MVILLYYSNIRKIEEGGKICKYLFINRRNTMKKSKVSEQMFGGGQS